ncbi:MAG: hypothetical protein AB7F87_02755 [Oligoflexales bacterium]
MRFSQALWLALALLATSAAAKDGAYVCMTEVGAALYKDSGHWAGGEVNPANKVLVTIAGDTMQIKEFGKSGPGRCSKSYRSPYGTYYCALGDMGATDFLEVSVFNDVTLRLMTVYMMGYIFNDGKDNTPSMLGSTCAPL